MMKENTERDRQGWYPGKYVKKVYVRKEPPPNLQSPKKEGMAERKPGNGWYPGKYLLMATSFGAALEEALDDDEPPCFDEFLSEVDHMSEMQLKALVS